MSAIFAIGFCFILVDAELFSMWDVSHQWNIAELITYEFLLFFIFFYFSLVFGFVHANMSSLLEWNMHR